MVQQPAEARSLNGVEAPQLSRDAVHEPFMFVLKTKILQDFDRRCLNSIQFNSFFAMRRPLLPGGNLKSADAVDVVRNEGDR